MGTNTIGPELYTWVGLSTETKPREAFTGQLAVETDTNDIYKWFGDLNSGGWVQIVDAGRILASTTVTGITSNYRDDVALGNISGVKSVTKYGRNINVDATATDIWDLGTQPIWLAPTAARIHAIVSSSGDDDSATGAGAKTIRIWGLKTWATAETSEDIVMDGAVAVNTVNSYVIIHRMTVLTWGANGPNVGIIKATAASDSTITSEIIAGAGQTQMAIYGVPSTQTFLMGRLYANMNRAGGATPLCDIKLLCNDYVDTLTTKYKTKHTFGLSGAGTSAFTITYAVPKVFAGPCILKVQAFGSTTNLDVSAGFDGTIYTN